MSNFKLNKTKIKALKRQAQEYEKKGDLKTAIVFYSRIIDIYQDDVFAYKRRALLNYKLGQYYESIEDYTVLINKTNNPFFYKNRASLYKRLKKFKECKEDLICAKNLCIKDGNEKLLRNIDKYILITEVLNGELLDEEKQILAVKENPKFIEFINNPTKKAMNVAVNLDGNCIKYINNPPEDILYCAIRTNWEAIQYIGCPSKDLQFYAINKNERAIEYIKTPHKEIINHPIVKKYFEKKNSEPDRKIPEFDDDDRFKSRWSR